MYITKMILNFFPTSFQKWSQKSCCFHSSASDCQTARGFIVLQHLSSASQQTSPHTHTHTPTHPPPAAPPLALDRLVWAGSGQPRQPRAGPGQRSTAGGRPALAAAVPLQDNCWRGQRGPTGPVPGTLNSSHWQGTSWRQQCTEK